MRSMCYNGGKQPADIKNSKNQDEVIRSNVRKSLRDILVLRCKETEMAINHDVVGRLSKRIENELLKMFNNETGQKYKTKYRSLIFNLKDRQNKILYKRVVSGEINPRKLVQMSPEQLATPELAQWRQQENKHHLEMVKKREQDDAEVKKNPPIKKTHKGEVVIDDEKVSYETLLEIKAQPTIDRKPKSIPSDMDNLLKDTTEEHSHHLFDSNCKICTGKIAPPGESQITGVSTTVIQAVPESSMPSPQLDETESYVSSSPPSPDTSEITSPVMSPSPGPRNPNLRKQPSVWRGFIMMQKVAKFVCTAYAVSGSCESLMDILPDSIHVCGRIPPSQVWDYLGLLREGRKNHYKYLDVIRFEMSSDEEKSGYIKLYTYFYTRQRIGVIGNCYSGIKDIYILPLASHDPIPTELRPLPGLPKPRPHMLLGIIVRVKSRKSKVTDYVDSSPEMIVPKKKKKKKDKKKEKDAEKDAEKEKNERDIERERAEITLERERVELEAQKKLIDIIFKNRASEGFAPETLIQASVMSGNLPSHVALHQTPQPPEIIEPHVQADQFYTFQQKGSETVVSSGMQMMNEEDKQIEEEQLRKLKEQQEEILKLQSEVGPSQQESEVVMIPDPESIAKNMREIVLNQISETIQEVSEPHEQTGIGDTASEEIGSTSVGMPVDATLGSAVDNIVSLRNINASLMRPLTAEEKDPVFKAWLERPTNVNPLGQQTNLSSMLQSQNEPLPPQVPVHTSPDLSPTTQIQFSSGFTSPTSSIDQAHVQTLLSSISSSIAHVQSMVVSDPNDIPVSDGDMSVQPSFEAAVSSSSHVAESDLDASFEPTSDPYSSSQDIDQDVLQDIEERFRPVHESTADRCNPSTVVVHSSQSPNRRASDISALQSPDIMDMQTYIPHSHPFSGIVDISPPSKPLSPDHSTSPVKSSTSISISSQSSSEEEERQKSDDDYALDLIEDIQIPAQIPRRATLFSMDLIKMRAGIKMPELPEIKLPDKKESKVSVAVSVPPPPIPAGIPTVPIPPDIKLPPGIPFPPLPPAPPPSSGSTGAVVVIDPVEDIRTVWSKPNPQSIANSSCCNRPVSSSALSTVDTSHFNRPTSSGLSSDPALERPPPFSDAHLQPISSKSRLPIRSMDSRTIPSRDARTSAEIHPQHHDRIATELTGMKPGEQGHPSDPLFRGMPPPMQNIPGPRQGIRMPSRPIDPLQGNRFVPPGPPGPMPQRPMLGNRFPHPVLSVPMQGRFLPPGRLQCDRFPLDQPVLPDRDFRAPMKHINNPAMRSSNPSKFDLRNLKFQELHDRGRDKISLREPLFDVPLPRRPLDPHLNIDRPERMPPPFESQRPPFKPEVQRPPFQPEMQRMSFEPEIQRPPFEPEIQRPPFEPEIQRPPFEPEIQRPPFEPEIQRPPFAPKTQRPPFAPETQRPPFAPETQRSSFESETQRPPFKSENSTNSRIRDERSPPSRDHARSFLDEIPQYEDFPSSEIDRRDRKHERTEYDRSDQGYSRNRDKFYHKNRQKFVKYGRHGPYEGRRDPPRSSEFRYRPKNDDVRDRYDSKSFSSRDDGPSKAKQKRSKSNKYVALTPHTELEELEEGEVL